MAPPTVPLSSPPCDTQAFTETVQELIPDLPLLMHGSGDVPPSQVNKDTAALVAELTVQYMAHLVDAAVDAHDLLTDGSGGILPPPAVANRRRPALPTAPPTITTAPSQLFLSDQPKKRRRLHQDYWDDALPEPNVRSTDESVKGTLDESEGERSVSAPAVKEQAAGPVHVDEWVGVAGVDFWETDRSRRAHVAAPLTIGTQSFVFPICHDSGLYGRVMELQAERRTLAPVLVDTVWMDMVEAEAGRLGSHKRKRSDTAVSKENQEEEDQDEEQGENEDAELLPTWPGLETLLPTHCTDNL